jgi:hypothetical protein
LPTNPRSTVAAFAVEQVDGLRGCAQAFEPDPDQQGIASGHQPIAIVLDLVHPARPGWRLLAG